VYEQRPLETCAGAAILPQLVPHNVANASMDKSRDAALEHEQMMLRKHERSYDMAEGLRAFSEKRTPQFQGR